MDTFFWLFVLGLGAWFVKSRDERRRIALLGGQLRQYQIEKLMEQLTEGYLRALAEDDPQRRDQVWQVLTGAERQLGEQFGRFAADMAALPAEDTRVCRWPLADRWWPRATLDLRAALQLHAQGLQAAANAEGRSAKAKARGLLAEMMLMQHTCHWFCKSKTVASARLLARHRSTLEQVLEAVSPETRRRYTDWLTAGPGR
ncbi:hypothetical protein [Aquabacterium sp. A08]|uniref:hypothetical protein n=1 Tax=Aquabacterium sp. A08 TaxID=2718532 RepID=UPI0014231E07|nr:hypothetical protein [Aquabacterium sp. A08]NIC43029.1 hypothetical protein [Aquabacterium sp. A08]